MIPRFDKGVDDRIQSNDWDVVQGKVDIILFEGWRVGIKHPKYLRFNAALNYLIYLDSELDFIREWKLQSSE